MSRILFIGLPFYTYTDRIVDSLRRKGHEVDFHPIEDRSFLGKTVKRFAPERFMRARDAYHARIIEEAAGAAYDHVLFLQTHQVSHRNMERLRATQPKARFALYNWDSLKTHDYAGHLQYFDKAMTFDWSDAERLGIAYLPLFALPEFFDTGTAQPARYDLCFVGQVATMARYEAIAALDDFCQARNIRLKLHLKCSPPIYLGLLRRGLHRQGVTLRSLSATQIIEVFRQSRAVFDFPNHVQNGYTMRLIESMCAGKKVVTSNTHIETEAFYSPDRFLALRGLDFGAIPAFLDRPLVSTTSFREFELDNFTSRLLA